jgi:hypothetical protein
MKRLINILLCLILVVGGCGFSIPIICHVLSNFGVEGVSSNIHFPLGKPRYLALDENGNIYCFSDLYNRLQIYDKTGQFIRGWFLPSNNFLFVDPNDETLNVITSEDSHLVYDMYGNLINTLKEEKGYYRLNYLSYAKKEARDSQTNTYKFESVIFSTKITKISPDGKKTTVISEPLLMWLLRTPFPVFLYIIVPLLVWVVAEALKKKKLKKQENFSCYPSQKRDEE